MTDEKVWATSVAEAKVGEWVWVNAHRGFRRSGPGRVVRVGRKLMDVETDAGAGYKDTRQFVRATGRYNDPNWGSDYNLVTKAEHDEAETVSAASAWLREHGIVLRDPIVKLKVSPVAIVAALKPLFPEE